MTDARSVALRFYEAFNAGDLDTYLGLLHEDVEHRTDDITMRGRDAAREYALGLKHTFPGLVLLPGRTVAAATGVVVTELQLGKTAEAEGETWTLAGTVCEIIEARDGCIASITTYYAADVSDRTGVAPMPSRVESYKMAGEQAALRRVATLVAEGAEDGAVFAAVNEEIGRIVGADGTALVRFEPDDTLALLAAWSARDTVSRIGERRPLDASMRELRETGRPRRFDPLPATAPFIEEAVEHGVRSAVGVPIVVDGRVWGIVFAYSRREEPLPSETEARITGFTELVSIALSNAQARNAVQQLADEQAALRRVAELVARGVAPEELFATVADEASALVAGEPTSLLRFDDDGCATVVATCGGPAPVGARFPISSEDDSTPAKSVGAPIVVEDRVWGMLGVTTPDRLLPREAERRLHQFTEMVASALANAHARAEVQRLADEQAALRRVAELVASDVSPDEVLHAVVAEASGLLGDVGTALSRYEPEGDATVVAVCRSPAPLGLRVSTEGRTCHGEVLRTGRAFRVTTYAGTPLEGLAGELGVECSVGVPIIVAGRVWGMLSVVVPPTFPLQGIEERLAEFAKLTGTAIANAQSRAELTASRARVVAAADESRRRVQRDVHDGAQQRLVQTIITLKLARRALGAQDGAAATLIDESLVHAERAAAEMRDLVRGILPAALTQGGLRHGVESLIDDLPLPVETDVRVPRLPSPVETTAYFVVAEALTNVVKHAGASRAHVSAGVDDGALRVVVRDDGAGGADAARGSGLTGLRDRVEAADGTLVITSPRGEGTTVCAELPLEAAGG